VLKRDVKLQLTSNLVQVAWNGVLSDFLATSDVEQGGVLSPVIFPLLHWLFAPQVVKCKCWLLRWNFLHWDISVCWWSCSTCTSASTLCSNLQIGDEYAIEFSINFNAKNL